MVWLIILAFPAFFGAMWVGIMSFLAWASGWRTLARVYGAEVPEDFAGKWLIHVTLGRGRFPRVHYRGALLAEFRSDALVLKPQILFRWAHPPLVIPRKVISAREKKGLLRPYLEVRTAADETISFHMYVRQFGWPEDIAGPSKERASP